VDISLSSYTYTLPIRSVGVASSNPLVLSISGDGFINVRDVYINDTKASRYEVLSESTLLVEVPIDMTDTAFRSVRVVASGPVVGVEQAEVTFGFETNAPTIRGISALTQRFLKILLTTPNTSYAHRAEGGGVLSMLGAADGESLSAGPLMNAVVSTRDYLLEDPKFNLLPVSERIKDASVLEMSWDKESQAVQVSIRITNQLDESADIEVSP
jgi:hypothetical protein